MPRRLPDLPDYFARRQISSLLVEVPPEDWGAINRGLKTEFRKQGKLQLPNVDPPTPVVCYSRGRTGAQHRLMVLERIWHEPLGATSPESLKRMGFETMDEFRREWVRRGKKFFRPLAMVTAYRVRTTSRAELPYLGELLLEGLYGRFIADGGVESAVFS